jgi:hypothetical protein
MAAIKSFTDLEQSKKLAEILPLESADMYYTPPLIKGHTDYIPHLKRKLPIDWDIEQAIPCWSLAALLDIIPKHIKEYNVLRTDIGENDFSIWYDEVGYGVNDKLPDITMECPIDACYELILKLKEMNLL